MQIMKHCIRRYEEVISQEKVIKELMIVEIPNMKCNYVI